MEGDALHWLQWREKHQPFTGWEEFRGGVLERFPPTDERTAQEELFGHRQTGTVQEFRSRFEMLSAAVEGLSAETMKVIFINGLVEEVRAEVKMFHPRTLVEKKNMVVDEKYMGPPGRSYPRPVSQPTRTGCFSHPNPILISPHLNSQASSSRPNAQPSNKNPLGPSPDPNPGPNRNNSNIRPPFQNRPDTTTAHSSSPHDPRFRPPTTSSTSSFSPRRDNNFRRLSDVEFRSKVEKGLCFRRDEKIRLGTPLPVLPAENHDFRGRIRR